MSRNFVVIYEASTDFMTATEIADRVLLEQIHWLDETQLDSQRKWIGEQPLGISFTWKSIPDRAREQGIRVHGHFNGEPGLPDAQAARRAIAFVLSQIENVEAVLLIRDMDNQTERQHGLEQARTTYSSECKIVIGLAIRERECWVISGFDPANPEETERLAAETRKLGWNPCLSSHELTAGRDDRATKSPKRVLKALTDKNWNRERDCWLSTPLNVLKERGAGNGLAKYLDEIEEHLLPLITGHERKSTNP